MRQFAKPFFIVSIVVVALYTLLILGINVYLQSEDVQRRIRAAISEAAGVPVEIRLTSYTPWGGVAASGITITGPQAGETKIPILDIESVHVGLRVFPLLQGKIMIRDILFKRPSCTLTQAADGQWLRPPDPTRQVPPTPDTAEISAPPEAPQISTSPQPVPVVEQVRIRQGRTVVYDSRGNLLAGLEGIDIDAKITPDGSVSGTLEIREATLSRIVRPKRITGHFSYSKGSLDISQIQADWAGGKLGGTFQIQMLSDPRFQTSFSADGISLTKLAEDAGMNGDGTEGELFGKFTLGGIAGRPDSLVGDAGITLQNARIQPLDFIRQIGEITRISELKMLQLKTAEAFFTIRDKKIHADKLVLESENLVIDATGPAGFDGKLKLAARLHMNEKLRKDLRGLIGRNFEESEREGYRQTPFSVTGSVSHPKTDLLEKIIAIKIGQDVGGLLKNLFSIPSGKPPDTTNKPVPPDENGG